MLPDRHTATSEEAILVVEDDPDIADLLRIHLGDLGYAVEQAGDGKTGLRMALTRTYALVILDVMLPELDGLEVCRRIRVENPYLPILMLTAKAEEVDKVLGLELGADDYLTKPFSIRELIARVKALFRRIDIDREGSRKGRVQELRYGDLVVNAEKRKVTLRDQPIELTAKEFDLLMLFAQHPGRAYNRQELLDLVWGYQYSGYSHTVNTHINRLRAKIEDDPSNPRYIKTVWGVGYRFIEREELLT
ncbi:MAG: response regulator transcription factor [Rhodothermales bacterium]